MSAAGTEAPPQSVVLQDKEIRSIFIGLMLIMFLGAIDQTIVGPALPTIGRTLGQFSAVSWIVTIYLLTATAATPLVGKLTDLYGRRLIIATSVVIFMLGSVGSALAPNMLLLIVARAVQGMGGGGLITLAQTVIGDIVSARERGKYQGYISGMFAVAGVAGPTLGGFLSEFASWRMIFWINIPISLIAIWACDRVLKRLPKRHSDHRLDALGAILLGISTVSLLLVLSWGGHEFPWGSPIILGLLAVAVVLGIVFVIHEAGAAEPIVPLPMLANPVVRITSIAGFMLMLSNMTLAIFVPLFFELFAHESASRSGMLMIGLVLGGVVGSFSSGQYMRFSGHYSLPPRVGLAVSWICLATIALTIGHIPMLGVSLLLFLVGVGNGLTFPVLTVSTQNAVKAKDLGVATAAQSFFRALGGMFGVSLFGALIVAMLPSTPTGHINLEAMASQGADLQTIQPQLKLAFQALFAGCAAVIAAGWVVAFQLPEIPLRSKALHTVEE
jgi:EmrB/QacA subfamily drug resistance transporter